MRNLLTKSLAVTAASGVLVVGGAGMASANPANDTDTRSNQTSTQVEDNGIEDTGNVSLDDILNGTVGDVASDNNVLNGNDTGVSDVLSGNDTDVNANPDVNADTDASADSNDNGGVDTQDGLLSGLL